jgi:hypothetical protein
MGEAHRTVRCASSFFLIRGGDEDVEVIEVAKKTEMVGERETEVVREMRGDRDI